MKKFFDKLFAVPKDGQLPEKLFVTKIAAMMLSILLCAAMLITTTFAWFRMDIYATSEITIAEVFTAARFAKVSTVDVFTASVPEMPEPNPDGTEGPTGEGETDADGDPVGESGEGVTLLSLDGEGEEPSSEAEEGSEPESGEDVEMLKPEEPAAPVPEEKAVCDELAEPEIVDYELQLHVDNSFILEPGIYELTLNAGGSASGYCVLVCGDETRIWVFDNVPDDASGATDSKCYRLLLREETEGVLYSDWGAPPISLLDLPGDDVGDLTVPELPSSAEVQAEFDELWAEYEAELTIYEQELAEYEAEQAKKQDEEESGEETEEESEDVPCEICGENPCVCTETGNVTEDESETPTVCETCGKIPCECEKTENVTEDEPETPTVCETCGKTSCVCAETEAAVEDESTEGEDSVEGESTAVSETSVDPEASAEQESTEG